MWTSLVIQGVLSLILILLAQYFWNYFRDNYTVEKTKHTVQTQTAKYKQLMEQLEAAAPLPPQAVSLPFLDEQQKVWMQKELQAFLFEMEGEALAL